MRFKINLGEKKPKTMQNSPTHSVFTKRTTFNDNNLTSLNSSRTNKISDTLSSNKKKELNTKLSLIN